ncbi:Molybdopterin molybdenumtransferase [Streptomyces sp. ADI92-24]|uniref:molybdopterin molybdotransferase MoeA n=1 Tax=Streptomyces sp. ADI92-24 TaxID=1522756 RepID=UPI000F9745E1|nr:molybdopterin molybdotransferase MoeA [Streptomyces sp. ADI92-24]RPK47721.1 Molybdopterin molybdenumtransferase [Streptomyces sp. ADI92-24]
MTGRSGSTGRPPAAVQNPAERKGRAGAKDLADAEGAAESVESLDSVDSADSADAEARRAAKAEAEADEERAVAQALALVGRQPYRGPGTGPEPVNGPGPDRSPDPTSPSDPPQPDPRGPGDPASPTGSTGSTGSLGSTGSPRNADRASGRAADRAADRASEGGRRPAAQARRRTHATAWGEARAVAARAGRGVPPRTGRLPLDHALGHVLAEPLAALTDLPSFDTSAMDGWAVAGPGPWHIRENEGVLAGHAAPAPLPDGDAVRIATGARIPADATAVIRSEHAQADGAKGLLYAQRQVNPGQDIRPRGQECRFGEQLLPAGTLVTPAVLGLAAAAGYDELLTRPRPRVDVLVLGDELLTAGLPHDGLIRDALGPMIGPWLRALGAEVSAPRRLGDDAEALRKALVASDADLVITTGGTAAGPVDHVHPVLADLGAELLVDGVAVRPGHPMLLARLRAGGPYLVGLPGNPLAAVSGLLTLAEPLLSGLAGRTSQDLYRVAVRDEVHGHPHDTRLVPVIHRTEGTREFTHRAGTGTGTGTGTRTGTRAGTGTGAGIDHVVPLHYNGPAMLRGIAAADGLAVVEPGGVRSGTEVEILDLPWAPATPWAEGCFT